jgi:single-strand DNA-binding protein
MSHKVHIIGRAGRDPEMRYTPEGTPVTSFSLASDEGWGDKKKTLWWRVSCWSKLAETVNQYVKKGKPLSVWGTLSEPRVWQGKDGEYRSSLELTAREVEFLGSKGDGGEPSATGGDASDDEEEISF